MNNSHKILAAAAIMSTGHAMAASNNAHENIDKSRVSPSTSENLKSDFASHVSVDQHGNVSIYGVRSDAVFATTFSNASDLKSMLAGNSGCNEAGGCGQQQLV